MIVARLAFLTALLVAVPLAHAWGSGGQSEPDTLLDATSRYMWPGADTEPSTTVQRVYFHVFPTLEGFAANPNLAAAGSRVQPTPSVRFVAILGVWKDCNRDGYIGLHESGVATYPAALLTEVDTCEPGSSRHNRDGWVQELIPIARPSACGETACGDVLLDPNVIVWGDAGLPGARGTESCPLAPLPRGTLENTGRLIRFADCHAQHRLIGVVNTVDSDGSLGLAISNVHEPEESDSRLVQNMPVAPYDNPFDGRRGLLETSEESPTFEAWDCESDGVAVTLAEDPSSSHVAGALGRALDQLAGDCETETAGPLADLPSLEDTHEPTDHTARRASDVVFTYEREAKVPRAGVSPWATASIATQPEAPGARVGGWRSTEVVAIEPQLLTRSPPGFAGPSHWTFYASLGSPAGVSFPGGEGYYGAEACGTASAGVRNGWACDPASWWRDPAGDAMPRDPLGTPLAARAGQAYRLRDVDCFDGEALAGSGVHASGQNLHEGESCTVG